MKIQQFNEGHFVHLKPKTETIPNSSTFCNVECCALLATVNKRNFTKLIEAISQFVIPGALCLNVTR